MYCAALADTKQSFTFEAKFIAHYNLYRVVLSPRDAQGRFSCTRCKVSHLAQNPDEG